MAQPQLRVHRAWWMPLAAGLTLAGFWGPWVDHPAAGLVVTGLDMPEYVKFLPAVMAGNLHLWRAGFYLPLVCVSVSLSLYAFDRRLGYRWPARLGAVAVAIVAGLNLLPPAWTPQRLLAPEFRQQIGALAVVLGVAALSPLAALIAARARGTIVLLLAGLALWFPVSGFLGLLDQISAVYGRPQQPGWGFYVMIAGLLALLGSGAAEWRKERDEARHPH